MEKGIITKSISAIVLKGIKTFEKIKSKDEPTKSRFGDKYIMPDSKKISDFDREYISGKYGNKRTVQLGKSSKVNNTVTDEGDRYINLSKRVKEVEKKKHFPYQ